MNKQELIKKYEMKGEQLKEFPVVAIGDVLKNLRELDEPGKVTIPQFVADWIEYCKRHNFTLFGCLEPVDIFESLAGEIFEGDIRKCIGWCRRESDKIARAWLDGYEVEKEERYLVKIKGNIKENTLVYGELSERYFFTKCFTLDNAIYYHTRKELEEAGFGWVFDCEGIEVEEVKD